MSKVDETFSESVATLQAWLQFLERKQAEYQAQLNRVRRGPQPAAQPTSQAIAEPISAPSDASEPVPVAEPGKVQAPTTATEDPWQ